MSRMPCDTPTEANAENGEVLLDGPEGLAVSLTPEAAEASAAAMVQAASAARAQTPNPRSRNR